MKILVTGSNGFIGKNLIAELKNRAYKDILQFDIDTDESVLENYCQSADFVFHMAGVNRPQNPEEFMTGNYSFTLKLLETLKKNRNTCPVMLSSSIQAVLNNPYGESKRAGEELIFNYSKETGAKVYVYRFPNVFGKWCLPNYNSAVATFCNNIARDLPIQVNDPNALINLAYIDDVIQELIQALEGHANFVDQFCAVPIIYEVKLGKIADLIYSFKSSRDDRTVPNLSDDFTKKLYSTYLSYLPEDRFSYLLKMNVDHRGSFTEFIRTPERGQISVNISKPGITKGNHWHHTKNEKFLVVSGEGIIRFRKINTSEVIEYKVSGQQFEVVDIPTGYAHNIENIGQSDLITVMWANEAFNPNKPDTYFLEV